MGQHDAFGNGQAQAVAAGLAAAGLVTPVKAVKETVQHFPLHGAVDRIGDRKADHAPLFFQCDLNLSIVWGIFQGVVQQNGQKLPDGILTAQELTEELKKLCTGSKTGASDNRQMPVK